MTTRLPGASEVLTHGVHGEPALDRAARDEARGDEHRGVRRVGARGDRRDDDRAVAQVLGAADPAHATSAGRDRARRGRPRRGLGQRRRGPGAAWARRGSARPWRGRARRTRSRPARAQSASCQSPWPSRRPRRAPNWSAGAPGEGQVVEGDLVDREERARRAVLGRHVADRRARLERERRDARAVGLDELADDAVAAQQLGDREHDVGRGHALARRAGEAQPDDRWDQHRGGLAEHRGLGLDAADAPAEHAEAVDHRRVRVGADERCRRRPRRRARRRRATRYSRLTWWQMPMPGRHDAEVLEGALRPLEEGVALDVALVLDRRRSRRRPRGSRHARRSPSGR